MNTVDGEARVRCLVIISTYTTEVVSSSDADNGFDLSIGYNVSDNETLKAPTRTAAVSFLILHELEAAATRGSYGYLRLLPWAASTEMFLSRKSLRYELLLPRERRVWYC